MTCEEAKLRLNAYVDGELDSAGSIAIESHVHDCASCSNQLQNLRTLSSAIEMRSLRFDAPPHVKKNVRAAVRASSPRIRSEWFQWRLAALAASMVFICAVTWIVATRLARPSEETQLVGNLISSHVRSMMADHLTDVASSDSHTVKPWFGGKLDYSPPVKDLTSQGFRLIGGRLDYLDNRPVAALVYQRRQHFINLFVWPSNAGPSQREDRLSVQGYNVVHWTSSGMTYWLISELAQSDLEECARLLKD